MLLLIVLTCLNKVLENPCCIRRPRQAKTTLNSVCLQLVESLNATSRGIHPPFIHDAGPGENRKKSPRPFRWDRILWNTQYPVCGENPVQHSKICQEIQLYQNVRCSELFFLLFIRFVGFSNILFLGFFNIIHLSFSILYISLLNILH